MNTKTFIDRPLLSFVICTIVVALGILAIRSLPIEKYPDIAPPAISVWASYPGASAETVQKSVVAPLEEAINGVENMTYMTSSAGNGNASITIFFTQGTNADMAAVNVQNRVARAQALLPSEVVRSGVSCEKNQPGQLRTLGLESPNGTYDEAFLSNYFINNIKSAIQRIKGVGKVEVFGSPYALRLWLKPEAMAARGLVPSDITKVLEEQNIEASVGALGENSEDVKQYVLSYTGRKTSVKEFENMVIRSKNTGEELLLSEVAEIELGLSDYNFSNRINGHPGVLGMISQSSGSNATTINLEIDKLIQELEKSLPNDIKIVTFDNTNDFLFAAIHEVVISLLIAIVLVLVVVFLFLHDLRSTIIPAVSILVSLIGTFAFMRLAGFSINMLTLFALVLVIGTVVDDTIVVVEAVRARLDSGYYQNSTAAAKDAMSGLSSALLTTTIIFMVVFIPVSFVGGTSGIFYKQFGLSMAVAVGLSLITAFTLSPALCALILKPTNENKHNFTRRIATIYRIGFDAALSRYTQMVIRLIRKPVLICVSIVCAGVAALVLINIVPAGFIPAEDNGGINIDIVAPPGYTQHKTQQIVKRISDEVGKLPAVSQVGSVVGFSFSGSGSNQGSVFIQLKPWDKRKGWHIDKVLEQIENIISTEKEATCFASTAGMIEGYGNTGGFEFVVQDMNGTNIETFHQITEQFLSYLNRREEVSQVYSAFETNYPQYALEVDASRCKKMGVSPDDVLNELGAFLGSSYISNLNLYNKVYQVTMQLRPEDRTNADALDRLFVRNANGEMLPVGQFVHLQKEYRPQTISRFNMFNSISVSGNVAEGSSSGNAIKAISREADKHLPKGYKIEFSGLTREQNLTSNSILPILGISLFFMYLVLVALYESLFIPFAVLLSVPFGVMGSLGFAYLFGVENNIYLQVGLIMLIGLLCKTAVLLTEYATRCRQYGMSLKQSAIFSAKIRLRPILMTSLTMIFGMLPLMFATGAGANGSRTIGVSTVGGMLLGTLALLITTPVLFTLFQRLEEKFKPIKEFKACDDPLIEQEMQRIAEYENKKESKI